MVIEYPAVDNEGVGYRIGKRSGVSRVKWTRAKRRRSCMLSHFSLVSLWPYELYPTRLLCPWGFSRQECWSSLPCSSPEDLPNPGIKTVSLMSPILAEGFFTTNVSYFRKMTVSEGNCDIQFLFVKLWAKHFFRFLNTIGVGVRCRVSLRKHFNRWILWKVNYISTKLFG